MPNELEQFLTGNELTDLKPLNGGGLLDMFLLEEGRVPKIEVEQREEIKEAE